MPTRISRFDILGGKEFSDTSGNVWSAIEGDKDELIIKEVNGEERLTVTFINGQIVNTHAHNPISRFKNILVTSYM